MARAKKVNGGFDFADMMNFGKFGEMNFGNFGEGIAFPMIDAEKIMQSQRRNFEVLTQANQICYEGVQAVAQRQAEIVRKSFEDYSRVMQEMAKPGDMEDRIARQADVAKDAYQASVANLRELTELSVKSNSEAAELLNKRVAEAFEEFRGILASAQR